MTVQKQNNELNDLIAAKFQPRNEANFALANAVSTFLMLPGLRAFWPFSSVNESGNVLDLSGQGRTLTNNSTTPFASGSLAAYAVMDGVADYFSRADEAGLDITGPLVIGGWHYATAFTAPASANACMAKSGNAAPNLGYILDFLNTAGPTNNVRFLVSSNGALFTTVISTDQVVIDRWYFIVGRYIPATELALWVNGTKYTNLVAIPAAIVNNAQAFTVGALATPANYLNGRSALCFLSAAPNTDVQINNLFEQTRWLFGV